MNSGYIICGIITLVLYIIGQIQEWREGKNVIISRGEAIVVFIMMLCGYYGLAIVIAVNADNNIEWLKKPFMTYKNESDETLESDDQKGE